MNSNDTIYVVPEAFSPFNLSPFTSPSRMIHYFKLETRKLFLKGCPH